MEILWLGIFLIGSWGLFSVILNFSSYHKYFWWAGPLMGVAGILAGYVFNNFVNPHFFTFSLVGLVVIFLGHYFYNDRKYKQKKALYEETQKEIYSKSIPSLDFEKPEVVQFVKTFNELSHSNSKAYFHLSCLYFLIFFFGSYLYFFNKGF